MSIVARKAAFVKEKVVIFWGIRVSRVLAIGCSDEAFGKYVVSVGATVVGPKRAQRAFRQEFRPGRNRSEAWSGPASFGARDRANWEVEVGARRGAACCAPTSYRLHVTSYR